MQIPVKKTRRCGYCHISGHSRRKCLVLKAVSPKAIPDMTKEYPSIRSTEIKSVPIAVRTYGTVKQSPHTVDLRSSAEDVWQSVPVYTEPKPEQAPVRMTVDFADVVAVARRERAPKHAASYQEVPAAFGMAYRRILGRMEEGAARLRPSVIARREERRSVGFFHSPFLRYAAAFMALLSIVPFPAFAYYQKLKQSNAMVVAESTNGFLALQSSTVAALHANMGEAQSDLTKALGSFGSAQGVLEHDHRLLLALVQMIPYVGTQVSSRQNLLLAGQDLALGNTSMLKGIQEAETASSSPLTDRLVIIRNHMKSAIPQYESALDRLDHVDATAIPAEYQESFHQFQTLFATIVRDMKDVVGLVDAIQLAVGGDSFKRYIVVFQNNHELRPTGGFMGSFAVVDIQKGKILHIDVPAGGTYDLQGQMTDYVKPPGPLQLANARWEFQDANWFPDFSASAQKIEWFYEHGRSTTVDGVIAVNATVLERLLALVGPIHNDTYHLVLASDTALDQIQDVVENGEDKKAHKPKAILADLLKQFLDLFGTIAPKDAIRLVTGLQDAARQKDVQVYFNDPHIQDAFDGFGWTGRIAPSANGQDYLGVFQSNIQGQKTDAKIEQTIAHQAAVDADGSVVDTVVIRRAHHGVSGDGLYGGPNVSYVRVYVPRGATLIDAGGFTYPDESAFHAPEPWYHDDADLARIETRETIDKKTGTRITEEFDKTVFGNWMQVNPGETSEVYFTYRLPMELAMDRTGAGERFWKRMFDDDVNAARVSSYSLFVQKQSGLTSDFSTRIVYPHGWTPIYRSDDAMDLAMNGGTYDGKLDADHVIGLVMEQSL